MSIAHMVSRYNRERKWRIFKQLIQPNPQMNVLDVGFSDKEYSNIDNFIEKNYPYPHNLTALGIDTPVEFPKRYPNVNVVQYDGIKFPFNKKEFYCCWSNAVIEHVGDYEQQVAFLMEVVRVSNTAFITTPNRYFPIEVHTRSVLIHYFPKVIFDKFLRFIGKGWATGNYMNLLSLTGIRRLLKDANITKYKIIKNKLLFFTLDFAIIIYHE